MKNITQENQNLAQFVGKVFGDDWSIAEHLDENQQLVVYVLSGKDADLPDVISHATIGLSDRALGKDKSEIPLGAEIVACGPKDVDYLDGALANVANAVLTHNMLCKPGTIFANALGVYDKTCALKHFLFTVPSMWNDTLYPLQFKTKTVLWLQAIPITDAEKEYAEKHGASALGEKLEETKVDLTDFGRASAV